MNTTQQLARRLELVRRWYLGMIAADSGMLEYLYVPERDAFLRDGSPIRDIASVWDAALLADFLGAQELRPMIRKSLQHYAGYLVARGRGLILDPSRLGEPSSVAHSAFMILALSQTSARRSEREIEGLSDGIIAQQRADGSYKIYFHDMPDDGEELYSGEAMLALLQAYRHCGHERYVQSVERAFRYYDGRYFQRGRVADRILVFFANWQSQACRLLFECAGGGTLRRQVTDYLYRMHDRIVAQGFYGDVERHPYRQASVEVACALEGLNDAYAVALVSGDRRLAAWRRCICVGLGYLLRLQCTDGGTASETGGFGMALDQRAQRIDVTGHAASAFMKSIENRIDCSRSDRGDPGAAGGRGRP